MLSGSQLDLVKSPALLGGAFLSTWFKEQFSYFRAHVLEAALEAFVDWWQHIPGNLDPVIFYLGRFPVRWYGTMYLAAFATVYLMMRYRISKDKIDFDEDFVSDAIMWAILGLILGARLGYVLFYGLSDFFAEPWKILSPVNKVGGSWKFTGISGMSYHGGLIGVIVGWYWYAARRKVPFFKFTDTFIPAVPLGYTFGRLGNFINGELYGRVTESGIGMYFSHSRDGLLRHPSQLYEAFFEGIVLFAVLWFLRNRSFFPGFISGLYVFGYGFVRFFIEYFREPDDHIGFVFIGLTTGQLLCIAMLLSAAVIWYLGWSTRNTET